MYIFFHRPTPVGGPVPPTGKEKLGPAGDSQSLADAFSTEMLAWYQDQNATQPRSATLVWVEEQVWDIIKIIWIWPIHAGLVYTCCTYSITKLLILVGKTTHHSNCLSCLLGTK